MKLRKRSEEEYQQAIQLYEQGASLPEIEQKIGISQGALYNYFKQKGILIRKRGQAMALAMLRGRFKKSNVYIPKTKWKIAYLAGLIDGEGSVFLRNAFSKSRVIPLIRVVNTDPKMIEWIHQNFGGRKAIHRKYGKANWKPVHRWETDSIMACKVILEALLPFLITKKKNAEEVLTFCLRHIEEWKKTASSR